ncbi:MAG TPA: hypothetical protein VFU31_27735 [Candidatus Binatia bacterium]|nr:hypothetical protein [Candidatus Binatia bacterium]
MDAESARAPYISEQSGLTRTEEITSLFQPDTILSAQYFDDRCRKALLQPEARLMLAILEDAIHCFQDNHLARYGKSKRFFDEAREWIFAVNDWVFGFENICSALGLDPEYIRAGLMRWEEKQLSNRRTAVL